MKPIAVIQARMGSTRLPGKVLSALGEHNALHYIIHRCRMSGSLEDVVVATTTDPKDDPVAEFAGSIGAGVFRGSATDVLERCAGAALMRGADVIVRITGDCPLIDPAVIDRAAALSKETGADYAFIKGYPRGLGDAEVLTTASLRRTLEETGPGDTYYREHVMTYITEHPDKFKVCIREAPEPLRREDLRVTVDEPADLEVVRRVCAHFSPRMDFSSAEVIEFLDRNPKIKALNRHVRQK